MFGVVKVGKIRIWIWTIKVRAGVGVFKPLHLLCHNMPPKTQDDIAALRLQEAEAQIALARATVEKLEAERMAAEAALRRSEAAEREAEKAKQMKKRTPTKPKSTGTTGGEEPETKPAK